MWSKQEPGARRQRGGANGWQGIQEPPQFAPPPGCDTHCWGYQPCIVGFTHPSYEGWHHTHHTHHTLPNCSHASVGAPLTNGGGCCHTSAYMAIVDEVIMRVPQVLPGKYVVRWRWDCEQMSPQIWSGCADIIIA